MENKSLNLLSYWLYKQFGGKYKWTTFVHNGVLFPPEYIPHKIPIIYEGSQIILEPLAEEYATLYAKYIETEYVTNRIFNKNFWHDWRKILGKTHVIQSLEGCDFKLIYKYLLDQKEEKNKLTKDEKEKLKKERDEEEKKYKIAILDGKEQPVGNFRMEPPGIFMGRGCHPSLGKIKKRIYPEDITLNLSKDAPIPELKKGKWGEIIHDRSVEWLASWKDSISGKSKYVFLASHSDLKAKSDLEKFERARKLKRNIKKIRTENELNLVSENMEKKQIATALYFIDNFALRVGNEKGEDQADTVGVTSLRVEHIELLDNNKVKLDFLGKDSVRYVNTVNVNEKIYLNIKEFMLGKEKDQNLFDRIDSNDLNKYLQSFMKDLTAKVFRTYNASNTFYKELKKISKKYENYNKEDKINILLDEFNLANSKVALLCNHQKNISKSFEEQMEKINNKLKTLKSKLRKIKKIEKNKERIEKIKSKINQIKIKKDLKLELKNISLGTSKVNYIDPRITVAFMKKHDLPVEKIFNKSLQEKFKWAFDVEPSFKW
jgi:DNA topoisomerase-1